MAPHEPNLSTDDGCAPKPKRLCANKCCSREICTTIGYDDFVVLRPCRCIVCPKCALHLVANRKFYNPACPAHSEAAIMEFYYVESSREENADVDVIEVKQQEIIREKDPCRFYQGLFDQLHPEEVKHKLILSLSYAHCDTSANASSALHVVPASITVSLDREYGPEGEKDEENLRKVFGLLHEPIIRSHGEIFKRMKCPRMTPSEFCMHMMHEDESLLLKLIYALATGEMTIPMDRIATSKKFFSRFLACCVAKEMIQRLVIEKPGPFQLMMGDVLNLIDAPMETKEFMSKIRVAAHRTTMERECTRQALLAATEKITLDPLSAFTIHFDNVGFKGRTNKWSQHTVVQICTISYPKLKEAGFYNGGSLSRQRKTFEEIVEEVKGGTSESCEEKVGKMVAKRIVGIKSTDWKKLETHVMNTIQLAMDLDLPDEQQCREFATNLEFFSSARYPLHLGNPIDPPSQVEMKETSNPAANNIANIAINELIPDASLGENKPDGVFRSPRKTFYEANDMTLDNVLHEDPNKKQTVAMLADYLEEASQYSEFDSQLSGGELPVRDMYAPATADGAPIKRWLDIKAEDLNKDEGEQQRYDKAMMFFGGFHFHMEFISMRGRLSRGIFSFFAKLWRPSLPQLNWILSISDPKEYLQEIPQYLLAHYRSAFDMLVEAKSGDRLGLTAKDVHAYMLKRAVEVPTCMAVLLDLRLVQISLMIRDSEKSGLHGDTELFLTTMRFALALFTVTHAINYAHIVCDFLEWWELSSDADKVFFKNWLYTKISPYGKPIWADRGVEWTVRHLRMFLGKRSRPNQKQRMETVVPDIPFRIKAKADLHNLLGFDDSSWSSGDWNLQSGRMSKVYFETVKAIYDTNLWGVGNLRGPLECDNPEFFLHAEEGEEMPMSNTFLSAFDHGQERAEAYYLEHHIVKRGTVTRSEEYVSLKLLPTFASARQIELQKMKDIRLSVEPKDLKPLTRDFPKEKILQELKELKETLYPEIPEHKKNTSRDDLIADLCKFRLKYFQDFPQVYVDTMESIEALELEDTFTSFESREKQILSPIYSFQAQSGSDVEED